MNPDPNNVSIKYHWFRQKSGNVFVIRNIESDNRKGYIFTKSLKCDFSVLGNLHAIGKHSDDFELINKWHLHH